MVNFAIADDSEKKPQRRNRSRRRRFRGQAEDRQPGNLSGPVDDIRSQHEKKMSCVCILNLLYLHVHVCIYIQNLHCINCSTNKTTTPSAFFLYTVNV